MQQNQPVAYASRAMSNPEVNHAHMEKELLAIVFGCERFNMYTYGTEIEVLSDQKPKVPPRLRLRLQKYYLKVKYVPGKFLKISDTLFKTFDHTRPVIQLAMICIMIPSISSIMLLPISQSRMLT